MQLRVVLFLLTVVSPTLVLLLLAWRAWLARDRQIVHGNRRILFLGGAMATAISVLFFVVFTIESPAHEHYFLCLRGGFWTAFAGLLLCCFGRGRSRPFGVIAGGLIWTVWLMFAATPP
jgi:hypothetical protein